MQRIQKNKATAKQLLTCSILFCSLLFLFMTNQAHAATGDVQPSSFTDNPDPVPARGIVTYTVVATDNDPANPVVDPYLELPVPAGFSFVSATDSSHCGYGGVTPSSGGAADKVRCDWSALPSTNHTIDFVMQAPDTTGTYNLTVTMGLLAGPDANPANDSEIVNTQVSQSSDLELLSKTGSPNPVAAGGIVNYEFSVINNGPFGANSLTLNDTLPTGLSFYADNSDPAAAQDSDWTCAATGQDVACTSTSLALGATSTFSFRVKVTKDTTGAISNAASVTSATPEPKPDNNTATHDLTVVEGTDMVIAKMVDTDPVIGGQPAEFTFTATNNGPMTASNVVVTDTLPVGYTAISVLSSAPGWTCGVSGVAVSCSIATVTAGTSAAFTIQATPPTVTAIVTHQNTAQVATDTTDPISTNNTITVTYPVAPDTADLFLSKVKTPNPVAQGEDMESTIVVSNNGPRDADPVQMIDVLSTNETYVGYSGTGWTCSTPPLADADSGDGTGGTVVCTYGTTPLLAGDSTDPLIIITNATNSGTIENNACTGGVLPAGADPAVTPLPPGAGDSLTGNNCSSGSVLSTTDRADLQVNKSTDDATITAIPLENSFSYTVTVYNAGPQTAGAVDFRDTVPQYVAAGPAGSGRPATPISYATDQGSCTVTNALVHCGLGDIASGNTVTVQITVERPMKEGLQRNWASAYSTLTGDQDRSNNEDFADVTVLPITDVEVTDKLVSYAEHPAAILAGTVATYTIGIRNNGPSLAENVLVADVFSGEDFYFLDASVAGGGSCLYDGGSTTLNCDLGDMGANSTKSITVTIRPDHLATVTDDWQIDNTATVSMDTPDSNGANNARSQILPIVLGEADLAIEKNESPDFIEPVRFVPGGGTSNYLVYEIEIDNRGPSLATGVIFSDNMTSVNPAQTPFQQLRFVRDTENSDGSAGTLSYCTIGVANPFEVDGSNQNITCALANDTGHPYPDGQLPAGTSYTRYLVFEVLMAPNPISGDSYHNEASVTANEIEPTPGNNAENENTTVRTIVDLELLKDDPAGPVEVEENFAFTITVTNHGPGASPETRVSDTLPGGMVLTGTPSSATANMSVTCSGAAGDTSFTCSIDSDSDPADVMLNGESVTITVPVKMTEYPATCAAGCTPCDISNSASVSGIGPEPVPDGHPNQDSGTVQIYPPATLGNLFWLDANADGIQDSGELRIAGATVNLLDSGNTQVDTTTTNSSGIYSFTIYHAADYRVEFIKPNVSYLPSPQDAGADDNLDSDAAQADGRTELIPITYCDANQSVDTGMYQLLSLGNRIWEDRDADGTQDAGELGIEGVQVLLHSPGVDGIFWNGDDVVEGTVTTDATGNYLFTDLVPGDYAVQISPPAWVGYLPSPVQTVDPNNNVNNDSNIASTPSTGVYRSAPITLSSGLEPTSDGDSDRNTNLSLDFGLVTPARLGNRIWLDENSNGIQDAGEPGLANVTVHLKDSSGAVIATTVTDSHGGYLFTGLAPDDYFVEVDATTLPAGISQTTVYPHPGADYANQNQSLGHGYGVHLTSNGENLTADFGYNWSSGALGDRIWIDSDGDGIQDDNEVGVSGVELTLYSAGPDGLFWTADDVNEATTSTDASGNYIFAGLAAGAYVVEVTDSTAASHNIMDSGSYSQSGDPDHFGAAAATAPAGTAGDNRSTLPVILAPGDTFINVDFGYRPEVGTPLHNIGDTVWLDNNLDGIIDSGENGLTGVTIALQNAAGNFIATTTTGADGMYLFEDLPDGNYTVVVTDSENILSALHPTYDWDDNTTSPDGKSSLTLSGADDLDQDFGYAANSPSSLTGTIGDTIFLDRNTNNSADAGEGMEGVRVVLKDSGGTIIGVTYTDENGTYLFSGLAAGDYTVEVDSSTLPAGLSNSFDPDGGSDSTSALTLGNGEINLDQDFGYVANTPGSIGNFVWKDTNADGIYQADGLDGSPGTADDETPFAGVSIDLYSDSNQNNRIDPGEPRIGSTVTDSLGAYLFSGLPPGDYNVKVSDRNGILMGYWHSRGTDNTDNHSQIDYYALTLPGGGSILTADFGYYAQPGSLGNRVWKDEDVNGVYEGTTDTALADVTVFLDIEFPDGTSITLQTLTDADGLYLFPNLLLDEDFNGIGSTYGNGGDEPAHTVRIDNTTIPTGLISIYPSRGSNTDTTSVGGTAADEDDTDMGSDSPTGEPGYPPMGSRDITNDFGY
ncbi:MAG: carboxypeptidase regulatory-like domain-containing protein, partial [Proteobacteria bacterium]|nr:carboxypeptidase regulatory-like domain-containing protein [Pseudomonadota bacterium]